MRLTVINARGCTTFRLNTFRRIDTSSNTNTGLKQSGTTFLVLTGSVLIGNAKDVWPQKQSGDKRKCTQYSWNKPTRSGREDVYGKNQRRCSQLFGTTIRSD